MEQVLEQPGAAKVIDRALERVTEPAAVSLRSRIGAAPSANVVPWEELPEEADALASALEGLASQAEDHAEAGFALDSATMIRVRAGGAAQRGRLDWSEKSPSLWSARGGTGTSWHVEQDWNRWGVVIADWDRPDWSCASRETAMRIAEEIDARPSFPAHLGVAELPPRESGDGL